MGGPPGRWLDPHLLTIRRWISAAREAWISCEVIAQQSASHGQGLRLGRTQGLWWMAGPSSGSRLKVWKNSSMSSSTASAKRIRSTAIPSSSSPAAGISSGTAAPATETG